MPSVLKAHKEYPAKEVVVMTISLDGDPDAARHYLAEHKFSMPAAHDKGMAFGRKVGARGVPMTYIIDRDQNIAASAFGPLDLGRGDVTRLIQGLLKK